MAAATAESHRKRGAQQALIAKRIERAEQLGCSIAGVRNASICSSIPTAICSAPAFEEAYEKEVYEWNVSSDHA